MYTLLLRGIEFHGFHGVPEAEKAVGHRFTVDIELQVEGKANKTDRIEDSVDYGAIAKIVHRIGTGKSVSTVERLAQLIGDAILTEHKRVEEVQIEVNKLLPPMTVMTAEAGVRLVVERG